ncbi:MAG: hypothetical protein AAGF24_16190 [Cyanobacteria bacterium P01_H01_bin.121]
MASQSSPSAQDQTEHLQSVSTRPYPAAQILKLLGALGFVGGLGGIWLFPQSWLIGATAIMVSLLGNILADMSFDLQRSHQQQLELNHNYEQLHQQLQTLIAQNNEFLDYQDYRSYAQRRTPKRSQDWDRYFNEHFDERHPERGSER